MATIRQLNETVAVAPQIAPDDLAEIKAAGFVAIVNNRPDDEEPGQPSGESIRAAAEAAGLSYAAIPVTGAGFSHPQLDAMARALVDAGGPVLAYCRSGTRSCNLWALAAAKGGRNPRLLAMQAEQAGYDLTNIRPMLDALAGASPSGDEDGDAGAR
ncbi:TIGR01244 family protein [Sphingomonas gellani]|uniref:TIGR01244 family protein n=1 Tax=Sphingomonas gellani TaxID=1166340 RepID=A0A1H8HMF9_9SPHN|nr:TIGR01244 family sulfur transferase [Sphingomonas gellani]SEN56818.1 TIGR01244 family protein [Sphingomonas gellani]